MKYKLILEYDGTELIGFQKNRQGASVQSLVEDAIFKFSGEHAEVVPCGRTDAGVHAIAMPAHFEMENRKWKMENVKRAVNFYLDGGPVSVVSAEVVQDDWHARFSCLRRNYRYIVANQDFPPVLNRRYVWWVPQKLDVPAMQVAVGKLIGNHDFTSLRAADCQAKSPVKTLDRASVRATQPVLRGCRIAHRAADAGVYRNDVIMDFSARSFLHHQVRNMVGTLVEIGRGKPFDIDRIFSMRDRRAAGPTAPACGLYFVSGEY